MNYYINNIYEEWKKTHGLGVKVGIIDSGFDTNNTYIKDKIVEYYDYGFSDIDHGTHVLGIMTLNTNISGIVKGLASQSQYYLGSICMGKSGCMDNICKILQKMISINIDVINMSFTNYQQHRLMKQLLYELNQKNTILVSSYSKQLMYPHSYPFVISAGNQIITNNSFQSSISNNKFKYMSGTSMQCAYISSIAAIAKSYDKKINKNTFMEMVYNYSAQNNKKVQKIKQYSIKLK